MASAKDQRPKQSAPQPEVATPEVATEGPSFETVQEGAEVSTEAAGRMHFQMGNSAMHDLVGLTGQEEEGVSFDEELAEEIGAGDFELDAPQLGGDPPPADAELPWDAGPMWGGEPPPGGGGGMAGGGQPPPQGAATQFTNPFEQTPEIDPLDKEEHEAEIEAVLGRVELEGDRGGDGIYRCVEATLADATSLVGEAPTAESLVARGRTDDPIGRPLAVGHFLAACGTHRMALSVARVLSRAGPSLFHPDTGASMAASRVSSLAVASEALEGGGEATDRACRLATTRGVWERAVMAAREAVKGGRLHAPSLVQVLLPGEDAQGPHGPGPSALGARGLERILPPALVPSFPGVDLRPVSRLILEDPGVSEIDAVIEAMTNGAGGATETPEDIVEWRHINPTLKNASTLLSVLGRTQVELAAAATAVRTIRPDAPVNATLIHADRALRQLARNVVKNGEALEGTHQKPFYEAQPIANAAVETFDQVCKALVTLRLWALSELAGEVGP